MWLVFFVELTFNIDLGYFGILPRKLSGISGILFAPVLHANIIHLVSNTIPLFFLGSVLFFYYPRIAIKVFVRGYFLTNILVWLAARQSVHIGASGLVYALASFLIFFGLFKRDIMSLIISLVVVFIYGGIFYGILPTNPLVSWESHLFGALVGLYTAYTYRFSKVI